MSKDVSFSYYIMSLGMIIDVKRRVIFVLYYVTWYDNRCQKTCHFCIILWSLGMIIDVKRRGILVLYYVTWYANTCQKM